MKNVRIVDKDGFGFEVHEVAIDGGKTKIGEVEVFAPKSLEDLASGIESGIETDEHACLLYRAAKTVEMQRQARSAKKGGKIPQAKFDEIYATITAEQHVEFGEAGNAWRAINDYIAAEWKKQQSA